MQYNVWFQGNYAACSSTTPSKYKHSLPSIQQWQHRTGGYFSEISPDLLFSLGNRLPFHQALLPSRHFHLITTQMNTRVHVSMHGLMCIKNKVYIPTLNTNNTKLAFLNNINRRGRGSAVQWGYVDNIICTVIYKKNLPFVFMAYTKVTYSSMSVNYSSFFREKEKKRNVVRTREDS